MNGGTDNFIFLGAQDRNRCSRRQSRNAMKRRPLPERVEMCLYRNWELKAKPSEYFPSSRGGKNSIIRITVRFCAAAFPDSTESLQPIRILHTPIGDSPHKNGLWLCMLFASHVCLFDG